MAGVLTPYAVLSYPKLAEPEVTTNEKTGKVTKKWGAAFVFDADTDISEMKQAALQVLVDKFGEEKAKKMLKTGGVRFMGGPHHTFRTDGEAKGYGEDSVFINASNYNRQPLLIDGQKQAIADPEQRLYPGAVVRALVSPYWYDKGVNKGIAWGLDGVQFVRDGERLDGRANTIEAFGEIAPEDFGDMEEPEDVNEDLGEDEEETPQPIAKKAPKGKKAAGGVSDLLAELAK